LDGFARRISVKFALVALLAVLVAGCTGGGIASSPSQTSDALAEETCGAPGSETDLSREPNFSANYLHRWTKDGCPVRLDILMTRHGADACGGLKVADIVMGIPIGAPQRPRSTRIYLRDPTGVFGQNVPQKLFDSDTNLPSKAVDTGYRQRYESLWSEEVQLWVVPGEDSFVYVVFPDHVERLPGPNPGYSCG
jgi:hypothetical protein